MRRWSRPALVLIPLVLAGCMAKSARGPRGVAVEEAAHGKGGDEDSRSVEDWEALIQFHESRIAQIEPDLESEVGTTPARPRPMPPSPGAAPPPERRPRVARRLAAKDSTLLCRRICRHVRAICYAATRICSIAGRLGDDRSRHSCSRARVRCTQARQTARKKCGPCGKSSRRQCRRRVHG